MFNIREWKEVWDGSYWVTTASSSGSAEENALRAEVEDDDCIEIFFVNDFDPEDEHGGGATWGSGTATSQIISTDANARYGIDLTHLAHEVGHVLGLGHPGTAATATKTPASTGTLMCPSGFKNDNPQINSEDNADAVQNPLLVFTIKMRSAGTDCDGSADCGACP
jgi:hypothetical protein